MACHWQTRGRPPRKLWSDLSQWLRSRQLIPERWLKKLVSCNYSIVALNWFAFSLRSLPIITGIVFSLGMLPLTKMMSRNSVRGLIKTPLFIHVYTRSCQIYSQSAISETPSLTYYLQYTRIPCHCIHSCEVLSTPHSHSYTFFNTTYSHAMLGLSSTSRIVKKILKRIL